MRQYRAIGVAALAGGLLAGCSSSSGPSSNSGTSNGIASQSASQIESAQLNAIKSARSVTINGTVSSGSKSFQINNGTFFSNGDVDATIVINGASFRLIKIGSTDYINASASYWTANGLPAAEVGKVAGVWVSIPDSTAHLGQDFSLSALATKSASNLGTLTKGSTSTVNGQSVISITSSTKGTLYVATTGTPYPVKTLPSGSGEGELTFSNW